MGNGPGYPIFLPDNGLRFLRLGSTREGWDGREDMVRQFILQCFTNRQVYVTMTTTPPTAQNLTFEDATLRTTQLTCVRADTDLKWRVPDASVGWDNVWMASSKHRPETHQKASHKHFRYLDYGHIGTQCSAPQTFNYCTGQQKTRQPVNSSTSSQDDPQDGAPEVFRAAPSTLLILQRRRVITGIQKLRRARKDPTST